MCGISADGQSSFSSLSCSPTPDFLPLTVCTKQGFKILLVRCHMQDQYYWRRLPRMKFLWKLIWAFLGQEIVPTLKSLHWTRPVCFGCCQRACPVQCVGNTASSPFNKNCLRTTFFHIVKCLVCFKAILDFPDSPHHLFSIVVYTLPGLWWRPRLWFQCFLPITLHDFVMKRSECLIVNWPQSSNPVITYLIPWHCQTLHNVRFKSTWQCLAETQRGIILYDVLER